MKEQSSRRAFSTLSICLLLIAVASALVSLIRDDKAIWLAAEWICGVSMVALVASLIYIARK